VPRLIEIRPGPDAPQHLTVGPGDVMSFRATGGRVREGTAVELIGIYVSAVVSPEGHLLSPAGPPTTVLVQARRPGTSTVEVVTGDPWHTVSSWSMEVDVIPAIASRI
jgi:hypothetical protein